ncbi:MAG TPA: hypothetical protein VHR86_01585 [Armatimonadota bacterium]|nr:hypothetical protein [Armatimonadota bacterium]
MGGALAKLTWKQVAVIGIIVCAIIGASIYFTLIKKQQEQIVKLTKDLQTVQSKANEKDAAQADVDKANADMASAEHRLSIYERSKMIPLSLNSEVDKYYSMVRLWREQSEVLGPLMERHIASTGVQLTSASNGAFSSLVNGQSFSLGTGSSVISVPKPPESPSAIPSGWYRISLGNITVRTRRGYPQVRNFLRSFTRAPRLVSVGSPSISGHSPNLTVTVPVSVYYLVKGGAAAAAAPAGGPGMGAPGGMPGGSPEMSGAPGGAPGAPGAPGNEPGAPGNASGGPAGP